MTKHQKFKIITNYFICYSFVYAFSDSIRDWRICNQSFFCPSLAPRTVCMGIPIRPTGRADLKWKRLVMVLDRLNALLEQAVIFTRFPSKILNGFISVRAYRAVAKPDRQTDGETKPRLWRITSYFSSCELPMCWISQLRNLHRC